MSYLAGKRLYLSGAIQHADKTDNWRTEPVNVLRNRFQLDVFDPAADPKQQWVPALEEAVKNKDFVEIRRIAKSFVKKDLSIVCKSDILVAWLPYKICSTGVHHEIITSNDCRNPTLLVSDVKEHIPLWYFGFIRDDFMFGGWDALYEYLDEVNAGKHKDNSRWAWVYGLL